MIKGTSLLVEQACDWLRFNLLARLARAFSLGSNLFHRLKLERLLEERSLTYIWLVHIREAHIWLAQVWLLFEVVIWIAERVPGSAGTLEELIEKAERVVPLRHAVACLSPSPHHRMPEVPLTPASLLPSERDQGLPYHN